MVGIANHEEQLPSMGASTDWGVTTSSGTISFDGDRITFVDWVGSLAPTLTRTIVIGEMYHYEIEWSFSASPAGTFSWTLGINQLLVRASHGDSGVRSNATTAVTVANCVFSTSGAGVTGYIKPKLVKYGNGRLNWA